MLTTHSRRLHSKNCPGRFIRLYCLLILVFCPWVLIGQVYEDGGRTRHRFAQTTVGLDVNYGPTGSLDNFRADADGTIRKTDTPALSEARLIIGGLHFWGHSDFYLAIPVLRDKASPFRTGVETGAKFYPFRIRNNHVVPFTGISFRENEYQVQDGPEKRWYTASLSAGITLMKKAGLFELFAVYDLQQPSSYYITRTRTVPVEFPGIRAGISYKRIFDTTVSAEKQWKSGYTKRVTDTLAVLKRLNGLTIGAGPSSAFFLHPPVSQGRQAPYLGRHQNVPILADIALGYYLHQPDVQLQLAYRAMNSQLKAYGSTTSLRRTSIALEGYKFLFDYHGFCFFTGLSISKERWIKNSELTPGHPESIQREKLQPGLVFGWDIRPNRLQSFYLRTHLRWYPGMYFRTDTGEKVQMDQLEFNYIQLVLFPGRIF